MATFLVLAMGGFAIIRRARCTQKREEVPASQDHKKLLFGLSLESRAKSFSTHPNT